MQYQCGRTPPGRRRTDQGYHSFLLLFSFPEFILESNRRFCCNTLLLRSKKKEGIEYLNPDTFDSSGLDTTTTAWLETDTVLRDSGSVYMLHILVTSAGADAAFYQVIIGFTTSPAPITPTADSKSLKSKNRTNRSMGNFPSFHHWIIWGMYSPVLT